MSILVTGSGGTVGQYFARLARTFDERRLADAPCTATAFNRCHFAAWRRFLDSLDGLDRTAQLEAVNRYMNRKRYVLDPRNYGVRDYWAAPGQFLSRDGDCEDYAITKYMTLRDLGFSTKQLRVVAVKDLNLKIGHAILIVFLGGGKTYLLDNQIKKVVDSRTVRHYKPVFSLNKDYLWRHRS
ncbi:MAG: transglutaminase-like cysteine peptidase [Proteobacteria bacterium]|nr:transglutaminase-like cysteine peptidase [Pseudomonadota bacterium]